MSYDNAFTKVLEAHGGAADPPSSSTSVIAEGEGYVIAEGEG